MLVLMITLSPRPASIYLHISSVKALPLLTMQAPRMRGLQLLLILDLCIR
jgi:hypothetical protein